jgi:DNA-binding NtrC family response regulator
LFGHERGAFTDARGRREGLIAQAEKGTLYLDEIDSLSRKAQVSLLRVLQEGRYRPVGSSEERCADVRVVAATNAPLDLMVQTGAFRADLYYRLCVFHVRLPPLRQRMEDVPPLAVHFLEKHASDEEHVTQRDREKLEGHGAW